MTAYVITHYSDGKHQPSCLPADLDVSGFQDITTIADAYRVWFDPRSGAVHRGQDYFNQMLKDATSVRKAQS